MNIQIIEGFQSNLFYYEQTSLDQKNKISNGLSWQVSDKNPFSKNETNSTEQNT